MVAPWWPMAFLTTIIFKTMLYLFPFAKENDADLKFNSENLFFRCSLLLWLFLVLWIKMNGLVWNLTKICSTKLYSQCLSIFYLFLTKWVQVYLIHIFTKFYGMQTADFYFLTYTILYNDEFFIEISVWGTHNPKYFLSMTLLLLSFSLCGLPSVNRYVNFNDLFPKSCMFVSCCAHRSPNFKILPYRNPVLKIVQFV